MERLKDTEGQVLLLSALVACACIIILSAYLNSVSATEIIEYRGLQRPTLDNVLWAQDNGLSQVAALTGSCSWEEREMLAVTFMSRADMLENGISENMLAHGIACSIMFNETLAGEYLEENAVTNMENIGGILVKRDGGNAKICGCACDLTLSDGATQYCLSWIKSWDQANI